MKVMRVNASAKGLTLVEAEVERPSPGPGELLIKVYAAGVTKTELDWYPTMHSKSGEPRVNAVPGHEFSGVVAETGEGVEGFSIGQEIYGMNDWFAEGATAEYCVALPENVAAKPVSLTHVEAAAVPIGALTALQGLFERAKLQAGERVLVHGSAGAVGVFVVQLAHLHGAHVIATASTKNVEFVRGLGADEVIDYTTTRFEEVVHDVDVVFDTVGGDTRERSAGVMKPGGRLVSIAADGEVTTDPVVRDAYFIVEPKQSQLIETARLLDAGSLKAFVRAVVPLADADAAYTGVVQKRHSYGKIVVSIVGNAAGQGQQA
jgi:NADPH:quinone reductase-like Zn-dependent oxidoreductase